MKVLQLCHKIPYPPHDGGAQAIYFTSIGLLEKGVNVKILAVDTPKQGLSMADVDGDFRNHTRMETVSIDTSPHVADIIRNFFGDKSYFIERFHSENYLFRLNQILTKEHFDVIQIEHLYLCVYIENIRKITNTPIILRPQNIEHVIWERYLLGMKNPFKKRFLSLATKRLKQFESHIGSVVDGIITLTKQDAEFFEKYISRMKLQVVPMGYKNMEDSEKIDIREEQKTTPVVYHLGSMDWMPNIEAVEWYIKKIHPLFIAKCKDVPVYIAGRKMPAMFYKFASETLIVTGEVNNALEFQKGKSIMIVPLRSGSGIRAKIVEGLFLGKTIISTNIGAQGIRYSDRKNLIIADTESDFAEAMAKCARSSEFCQEIGSCARMLASEDHDYLKCAKTMIDFYETIISK